MNEKIMIKIQSHCFELATYSLSKEMLQELRSIFENRNLSIADLLKITLEKIHNEIEQKEKIQAILNLLPN